MMRIACALAGLALLASGARADEKAEVKVEKGKKHSVVEKKRSHGRTKDKTKVESKSRSRMGGGTVSTTETTVQHDRPGIGNDSKTTTKETKERDAQGNVTREEKKVDK